MKLLATNANEIVVQLAQAFRKNPGPNESALVTQFNDGNDRRGQLTSDM